MSRLRTTSLLLVLVLLSSPGFAQGKKPAKPAPAPAKTAPIKPDAKKDTPQDYSQEAVVVELMRNEFRFENDGTSVGTNTARIKVQTQAGVQQLGQLVFGYNSANEKLDIVYLRVVKPNDGGTVTASADNFQDVPSQIEREAPSYTDYRERHVTVAALRPGDTLEYQVKTTAITPLIPNQFWFEHVFRKDIITLKEELVINVPKERNLKLKAKKEFTPVVREEGGRKIHLWTSTFLKRDTDEEAKKKRRKQAKEDFVPDVQLTTFQNWEELGAWYAGLQRTQMELSPALKSKVEELTRDQKSDVDKERAIYDFVAQEYRYVSLSFGVGRYQPHQASEIFTNKYGDCKDKHTLFSAMMKQAGFQVQPVLISATARKLDVDMPSPSQFNHVISAISSNGQDISWADTTTEIAPFGLLSANIRKKKALLAALDGTSHVIETPSDPPFPSTQSLTIEGTVSDLGKLKGTAKGEYRGDLELALRMIFRSVPENKWKDVAEYISYNNGIGGEVSDVKVQNLTDTHVPFKLEFNFSRPNFLEWANKNSELRLPLPAMTLAPAGIAPEDDDDDDSAKSDGDKPDVAPEPDPAADTKPIELGSPFDLKLTLKLQLPATHKSRTPVPLSIRRDYGEYRSSYKVEGQTLSVERQLTMKSRELPPERRSDYMAFSRTVRSDESQKVFVESLNAATGTPQLPADIKTDELLDSARDALQSQNYKVALELLKRAAEKEPKSKKIMNMLGDAHMGLRQFVEAEAAYRKQIALDAFDQFAYNRLARALFNQRRMEDSVKAYQQQLDINPLDREAAASLGEIFMQLKKYDAAAEMMEKAVSLEPENAFFQANLGRAYLNLKKEKEASAAFDKAVELAPSPLLWNNIAYELAQSDSNLDKAQEYAESAVSSVASSLRNISVERLSMREMGSVSELGSYWDTLGWVAYKRGNVEKAKKYIFAAWRLSESGEVGDHLGQIFEKEGKKDEAIRYYAESLTAERPLPETTERLTKLLEDKSKLDALKEKHKLDNQVGRTYKIKNSTGKKGEAEFFIVFSSEARLTDAKFISGSEDLKPFAAQLKSFDYGPIFPDEVPTKIVRRVAASCTPVECTVVLFVPETITSVN